MIEKSTIKLTNELFGEKEFKAEMQKYDEGGSAVLIEQTFTENGYYTAEEYEADGFSAVNLEVMPNVIEKTLTANGTYDASKIDDVDGYSKVVVDVPPTQFISFVDGSMTKITADDWNGCTSIRNDCFKGLTSLTEIETPETLLTIGQYAFSGCTGLTHVIISNSVTTINLAAFDGCSNVDFLVVGESVSRIYNYGFAFGNTATGKYIFLPTTPPTISSQTLSTASSARYYVPTPDNYRTATNWSASASKIFPLVVTVADLANIDTTKYTKACVIGSDKSYKEYTYDGSAWNEVV